MYDHDLLKKYKEEPRPYNFEIGNDIYPLATWHNWLAFERYLEYSCNVTVDINYVAYKSIWDANAVIILVATASDGMTVKKHQSYFERNVIIILTRNVKSHTTNKFIEHPIQTS